MKKLLITGGIFVVLALIMGLYWLLVGRFWLSTADAYVDGNNVVITPQVSGIVSAIYADNTQKVKQGQILLELDKADATLLVEKRKAELARALRSVVQLYERKNQLLADTELKSAQLKQAQFDYQHRVGLVNIGGISKEEFERSKHLQSVAKAALQMTQAELAGVIAELGTTDIPHQPRVIEAQSQLQEAWLQLQRCSVVAPVDGIVDQRHVQVGQQVSKDTPLLYVVPLDQMWITANFREDGLASVQIGQPASVSIDMYGSKAHFAGTVIGIGAGTGSVFSLLPPQNATGNWIKIVQRVPVRIGLLANELQAHPLMLGLSTEVDIDLHPSHRQSIPPQPQNLPLYSTNTLSKQMAGVHNVIKEIWQHNVPASYLPSGSD